jgi:hypothetical protein
MEAIVVRESVLLPASTEGDHLVTQAHFYDASDDDPLDPRFVLQFTVASGRVLRLRLPLPEMEQIAHAILALCAEKRWRNEPDGD